MGLTTAAPTVPCTPTLLWNTMVSKSGTQRRTMEADHRPHATPDETMLSLCGTLTTSCIVLSTAVATNLPTSRVQCCLIFQHELGLQPHVAVV